MSDSLFSYQLRLVRVKRREGRKGLVLGLVLPLEQCFCDKSVFLVF